MAYSFTAGHPLESMSAPDYAGEAMARQKAVKAHPMNAHMVPTHTVIDVTGHATNGNLSSNSYQEDD